MDFHLPTMNVEFPLESLLNAPGTILGGSSLSLPFQTIHLRYSTLFLRHAVPFHTSHHRLAHLSPNCYGFTLKTLHTYSIIWGEQTSGEVDAPLA